MAKKPTTLEANSQTSGAPAGLGLWLVRYKGQTVETVGQTAHYAIKHAFPKLRELVAGEAEIETQKIKVELLRELTPEEVDKLTPHVPCGHCGGKGTVRERYW